MKLCIHRGTSEIGGNCIEIWTDKTRVVFDIGMPLVNKDRSEYYHTSNKDKSITDLIKEGILPDIKGFYKNERLTVNGIVISHPHQDHYGFYEYLNDKIHYFSGEATFKLIETTALFTKKEFFIKRFSFFKNEVPFEIGNIRTTPYLNDHSAFDSYSFLIEADGEKIFYSGDFRAHGRKSALYERLLNNPPKDIDYLLLEGTMVGRSDKRNKSETNIEEELALVFSEVGKLNLVNTSGQNIDRIVSIYRAVKKCSKTLIIDVYTAYILDLLSEKSSHLPHISDKFEDIKICYTQNRYFGTLLKEADKEEIFYRYQKYKIKKEEIHDNPGKYVMLVRPSMIKDLDLILGLKDGGNFIYSLWEGYLNKGSTANLVNFLTDRNFTIHKIHTSGHADIPTLQRFVKAFRPRNIIPIHTFEGNTYEEIFPDVNIISLMDGEVLN